MEGSAKADLRNARTLLGILDGPEARRLDELVHDVTVGHRAKHDADVDALRRFVEDEAPAAARAHRIADETLHQLARSLGRVLAWWTTLPTVETLLDGARWPSVRGDLLEICVTADERTRLRGLQGTRDAVRACFEKYLSKHPDVERLRLVDDAGETVFTLVADRGSVRLAG